MRDAVHAVAPWPWVRSRFVLTGLKLDGGDAPLLSDMDGNAHGAYGLEGRPALVLVRPDGHIAFRDDAGRGDRLTA